MRAGEDPRDALIRSTIGTLAHVLNQLIPTIAAMNLHVPADDEGLKKELKWWRDSLSPAPGVLF